MSASCSAVEAGESGDTAAPARRIPMKAATYSIELAAQIAAESAARKAAELAAAK